MCDFTNLTMSKYYQIKQNKIRTFKKLEYKKLKKNKLKDKPSL